LLQARQEQEEMFVANGGVADFAEGKLNFLGGETVPIVAGRIL
jgi:hypothetical protein